MNRGSFGGKGKAERAVQLAWATPETLAAMQRVDHRAVACSLSLERQAPGTDAWALGAVVMGVLHKLESDRECLVRAETVRMGVDLFFGEQGPEQVDSFIELVDAELERYGVFKVEATRQRPPYETVSLYVLGSTLIEYLAEDTIDLGGQSLN